ncbi:G-patch domain-containing protein [Xylariomycetidae sp. FL2044]|nr:G-patch domain-containing protein [Xylariomycetidae sp. FL2044]
MSFRSGKDSGHEDEVPFQERRPFGAGLKRKRVVFVPASSDTISTVENKEATRPSKSVSDIYLSLVLPDEASKDGSAGGVDTSAASQTCSICSLPLSDMDTALAEGISKKRPHEASIAHQVCLTHSHPPSALDRSRMGLNVLQSQGWDPDSRAGLGAQQQGIQQPIKVKQKNDTLGIGVHVPKELPKKKEKIQKLDAKQSRKKAMEDKKRHERLRQQFYGNADVEKYLGHG